MHQLTDSGRYQYVYAVVCSTGATGAVSYNLSISRYAYSPCKNQRDSKTHAASRSMEAPFTNHIHTYVHTYMGGSLYCTWVVTGTSTLSTKFQYSPNSTCPVSVACIRASFSPLSPFPHIYQSREISNNQHTPPPILQTNQKRT